MIEAMKRVHILLQESQVQECVNKLQTFGAIHVDERHSDSESMAKLKAEVDELERIIKRFKVLAPKSSYEEISSLDISKMQAIHKDLYEVLEQEDRNTEEIALLEGQLRHLSSWGEFDLNLIRELATDGIKIHLFELDSNSLDVLFDSSLDYFFISRGKSLSLVAVIDQGEADVHQVYEHLPAPLELPEVNQEVMRKRVEALEAENAKLVDKLRSALFQQSALKAYYDELCDRYEFEKVSSGLEDIGDQLILLSGFVPARAVNDLKLLAKNHSFAVMLRDAEIEDKAPTKLKQNFVSRLINPVLNFLEVTPAYHEPDISFSFISFFTVFVAMIMGDAAYGLVILLLGFGIQLKTQKAGTFVQMLYVLGLATFAWGTASGSWFGAKILAENEFFQSKTIWQLAVYPELLGKTGQEQQQFIMWLCFTLGAVHITIAHLWRFVREMKNNALQSITNLGMVGMIFGLYYVLLQMVGIEEVLPSFAFPLLFGGLSLVVVFGQQEVGVNFFLGVLNGLKGLFTTFLDTVGLFGDIMSYIRLFAVGIASFSIASSFNSMGVSIMGIDAGSVQFLVMLSGVLVIVLGHVVNFLLSCLSVVVHAVRLNMLEFSNHIGLEWSGYRYQPFMKRRLK